MAITSSHLPTLLLVALLLLTTSTTAQIPSGPQKQAHIHFFFHDVISGSSPTAVQIVSPVSGSTAASGFGRVAMIDNLLTETQDPASKALGRAQGLYASASQSDPALLMDMNLAFSAGDFSGSSLAVIGRNPLGDPVREMTVVGGSGALRMARGYVLARTNSTNSAGDAVVEYDAYVLYYANTGSR